MQVHYRVGAGNFGEFSPHTINFRGLCKSGGARAPAAPPSLAPMSIYFRVSPTGFLESDLVPKLKIDEF